jgi:hypothetical protein
LSCAGSKLLASASIAPLSALTASRSSVISAAAHACTMECP